MKRIAFLNRYLSTINLPLLIFLVLIFNVKFVIKLFAILLLVPYFKDLKHIFSWKNARIPFFYLFIIILEAFKYAAVTMDFSLNYTLVFCFGILQWSVSLLAIYYLRLTIDRNNPAIIHNTIKAFFLLNFLVSLFFLAILLFYPSLLSYWGFGENISFQHSSAGDTILGITFDNSTVNATLNSIGLIYFLYKREYLFSLICIAVIVLCTSNVTLVLIMATLGLMVLTVRSKILRFHTLIAICTCLLFFFLISPYNRQYIRNYFIQLYILNKNTDIPTVATVDSTITDSNGIIVQVPTIMPDTAYKFDNTRFRKSLTNLLTLRQVDSDIPELYLTNDDFERKPGKLISFFQTYNYLKSDFDHLVFGSGMGRFSSKLAFRVAGEQNFGGYPKRYQYVSPEMEKNHLRTFLYYFRSDASKHSVMNYPTAVYNQLGEYGLSGALVFIFFYLGFFIKRFRQLTYGRYLIVALLAFFFMEYWFEMYSLVICFELFMLLNIKENSLPKDPPGKPVAAGSAA